MFYVRGSGDHLQERAAKEASEGAFVTYKQQMGFGVHVLVMMGTFYALGHTAVANMTSSKAHVRPCVDCARPPLPTWQNLADVVGANLPCS
jgi:hypothetical protein